jgi:hypothetical protein
MLSPKIECTRGFAPKIEMKRRGIRERLGTNLPRWDLKEIHSVRSGCPRCPHQLPLNPSCCVREEQQQCGVRCREGRARAVAECERREAGRRCGALELVRGDAIEDGGVSTWHGRPCPACRGEQRARLV